MHLTELRVKLNHTNTHFKIAKPEFKCTYTFDIDNGFAFLGKPLWKNVLALLKDVVQFNFLFVKAFQPICFYHAKSPVTF